jgi:hypothetical protein
LCWRQHCTKWKHIYSNDKVYYYAELHYIDCLFRQHTWVIRRHSIVTQEEKLIKPILETKCEECNYIQYRNSTWISKRNPNHCDQRCISEFHQELRPSIHILIVPLYQFLSLLLIEATPSIIEPSDIR